MGLTRLGILSLFVGDDDHAANLCVGGLCGQNQWAALWAKPVFCYLWVCLWAASQLASCCALCTDMRGPHLASCEALPEKWSSGCGHPARAADLRPLCVGSRPPATLCGQPTLAKGQAHGAPSQNIWVPGARCALA